MFFLIDKPLGISSFFAVAKVRKAIGTKKAGHSGTLDPLATGLLLVATDRSCRLLSHLDKAIKSYRFTVRLDGTTPSLDLDTEITPIDPVILEQARNSITREQIEAILKDRFLGKIEQIPPIYSAINISGQRAYSLARSGQTIELKHRPCEIFLIRIIDFSFPEVTIEATVSAGTYIRSIARDLGSTLGLSGYVTALRRTGIGHLTESLQCTVENLSPLPYSVVFPDIRGIYPNPEDVQKIKYGIIMKNTLGLTEGEKCFIKEGDRHIALVQERNGEIRILAGDVE